jgi:hypothetical protein
MAVKTYPVDITAELKTGKDIEGFIEASIEEAKNDTDPKYLIHALETAALSGQNYFSNVIDQSGHSPCCIIQKMPSWALNLAPRSRRGKDMSDNKAINTTNRVF